MEDDWNGRGLFLGSSEGATLVKNRSKYRKGLSSLYLPFYDKLCELLPDEWQPYSGFRSFAEQDFLFAKGRSRDIGSKTVTDAKGGESPHNFGCATDWTIWTPDGVPKWPKLEDPTWHVYRDACEKVGLKWGGEFYDGPHNELRVHCSWKHAYIVYSKSGARSAFEFLEDRMTHKAPLV